MATVFFVHDNQESPTARQQYLEAAGHRVHLFKGGAECLDAVRHARPDLVLLDVLLEGQNGFEVLRELRGLAAAKDLPVVMCSGVYTARAFQEEAELAGAQSYLVRPFELEDLGREVQLLLRTVRAA